MHLIGRFQELLKFSLSEIATFWNSSLSITVYNHWIHNDRLISVHEFDGLVFEPSGKPFPTKCGSNVYQVSKCFPMFDILCR